MQDNDRSKASARKGAGQAMIARSRLDDDARRRLTELLEVLADAGYDCELFVEQVQ